MITAKQKVIIGTIALATAYAAGRWASPTKVVTKVQTVTVQQKVDKTQTDTNRDKHVKTVVHEVRKPDGEVIKTVTITQDTQTARQTHKVATDDIDKTKSSEKEVTYTQSKVTLSALAGVSFAGVAPQMVYGASITKPVLGPVTVGAFGLSNGTVGASLGLTF